MGSGFLSGHSLSLSVFKVLLFWSVRGRFAGRARFAVSVDGFEYVRARFPSNEDILEQCSLCCVFVLCGVPSRRVSWSLSLVQAKQPFVWPLGERLKIEMEGYSPVIQSNL